MMEMENINENTIRVLIENSDLEERGITFLDLLGNQKQIESFFYSILEEVDVDNQFHESDAITFQVLPNGNGLELFISRGMNGDEDYENVNGSSQLEHVVDYIKKQTKNFNEREKKASEMDEDDMAPVEVVFKFQSFDDFLELAKRMFLESGVSSLYYYDKHYYLAVVYFIDEMTETNLDTEILKALEFAEESDIATEVLSEYGKLVIQDNALEVARHYFK
ncbi:negative regulator of genetic competence meca [Trichococcus palustris]|jgi:adapter protein MecA 1/2|uniref:Adapter protein MecA n=1 Tax=Trichococcus palustris TaxID=140314 RepID=A0A143YL68_9LACT|nr:adaptor protein MecA [Trichococcus palustris]CZQ91607.1 negative regulator of genetic competence meca [Trichococcus palustris]SFL03856.1 adapter protein MecA 1/2 [Trichococcus palustris]